VAAATCRAARWVSLYTGHSCRHGGIKYYARAGVAREIIKTISRHASEVVDGYIGEVAAEGAASLARAMFLASAAVPRLQELAASIPPSAWPPFAIIVNADPTQRPLASQKTHRAARPFLRTLCGWVAVESPWATYLSAVPVGTLVSELCGRCFPAGSS
jgi:hypothetical protein